jgi:LytS/YehU family sensor histidine kinase
MILKLSNLLDYLLYQADKPFVLLSDEINHIEDYIELEKMRFNDTLNIKFNVSEYNDTIKIAPMLLIPFVENSFKHGKIVDGKLKVHITIDIHQELLLFSVKNSSDSTKTDSSQGIGLKNI